MMFDVISLVLNQYLGLSYVIDCFRHDVVYLYGLYSQRASEHNYSVFFHYVANQIYSLTAFLNINCCPIPVLGHQPLLVLDLEAIVVL